MDKLPLSICTIIKNEEKNLPDFLEALKRFGLLEQLVIVDTGSTDRSVEILREYGVNPLFHEWQRDFAEAKNFAVSQAKTDWVLVLDADEFIREFPTQEVEWLILTSATSDEPGRSDTPSHQEAAACADGPGRSDTPIHLEAAACVDISIHLDTSPPEKGERHTPPPVSRIIRENITPQGLRTERITRLFHKAWYHYAGRIHEQLVLLPQDCGGGEASSSSQNADRMQSGSSSQGRLPEHKVDLGIHSCWRRSCSRKRIPASSPIFTTRWRAAAAFWKTPGKLSGIMKRRSPLSVRMPRFRAGSGI